MENNIWLSLSAIFLSGIAGVILTLIVQRKTRKTDLKHEVLTKFVENRYDILGEEFTKALNTIYHLFSKDKDVIKELKAFYEVASRPIPFKQSANNKLKNLYVAMCKSLNISPMEDELFLTPFNIKKY